MNASGNVSALKNILRTLGMRDFRLYFLGQSVSLIGTWMQQYAQGLLVFKLTNSSFYLGLDSALGQLPILLFMLIGGVIAIAIVLSAVFIPTAFLPGIYQGSYIDTKHTELEKLIEHVRSPVTPPDRGGAADQPGPRR